MDGKKVIKRLSVSHVLFDRPIKSARESKTSVRWASWLSRHHKVHDRGSSRVVENILREREFPENIRE
jgi:hypothetical protein